MKANFPVVGYDYKLFKFLDKVRALWGRLRGLRAMNGK